MAIFPVCENMKTICPSFIGCLPLLLASGVYHWEFVKSMLKDNQDHCVFNTAFSRDNYAYRYLPDVIVGEFYCNETGMKATGPNPVGQQSNAWSQFSTRNQTTIPSNFVKP